MAFWARTTFTAPGCTPVFTLQNSREQYFVSRRWFPPALCSMTHDSIRALLHKMLTMEASILSNEAVHLIQWRFTGFLAFHPTGAIVLRRSKTIAAYSIFPPVCCPVPGRILCVAHALEQESTLSNTRWTRLWYLHSSLKCFWFML